MLTKFSAPPLVTNTFFLGMKSRVRISLAVKDTFVCHIKRQKEVTKLIQDRKIESLSIKYWVFQQVLDRNLAKNLEMRKKILKVVQIHLQFDECFMNVKNLLGHPVNPLNAFKSQNPSLINFIRVCEMKTLLSFKASYWWPNRL